MKLNRGRVKAISIMSCLMVYALAIASDDWIGYALGVALISILIIGGIAYSAERWG